MRSRFGFSHHCSKINLTDTKECFMSMTVHVDDGATAPDAITLEVEELEEVIAPKLAANHNETLVGDEVELNAEELEEVIVPGESLNHNETLVSDEVELSAEEMDEVIAPLIAANHNETLVDDEVELNAEELEDHSSDSVNSHSTSTAQSLSPLQSRT